MSKRITAHTQHTHTRRYWFFTELFDSNGFRCDSESTRARTHTHKRGSRITWRRLCTFVCWCCGREPRLHFRREIFQFSMQWPLPRSHCDLSTSENHCTVRECVRVPDVYTCPMVDSNISLFRHEICVEKYFLLIFASYLLHVILFVWFPKENGARVSRARIGN